MASGTITSDPRSRPRAFLWPTSLSCVDGHALSLVLDTRLAAGAQAYAQACTWGHSSYVRLLVALRRSCLTHTFQDHRGRDYASRKGVGFGGSYSECVGENLACNAGSSAALPLSFSFMIHSGAINDNGWHNERQWWTCSSNTCASGKVCGHYTQVVWRNSIRLGCGATTCTTGCTSCNPSVSCINRPCSAVLLVLNVEYPRLLVQPLRVRSGVNPVGPCSLR